MVQNTESLQKFRDFYAQLVVGKAGLTNNRVVRAFASIAREDFVGAPPWSVFTGAGYVRAPSDNPSFLYQDILIGLSPVHGINNGQPSLHASCLHACAPKIGDSVLHIGSGTGYYTAILSNLVGEEGTVLAYEINPDLARLATQNLKKFSNTKVNCESGVTSTLPAADIIYVSAGATSPMKPWIDALKSGGRLIFPLTTLEGIGIMLLITKVSDMCYSARGLGPVSFIPCIGAGNKSDSESIKSALSNKSFKTIRSLHIDEAPAAEVWCAGSGWWLSGT